MNNISRVIENLKSLYFEILFKKQKRIVTFVIQPLHWTIPAMLPHDSPIPTSYYVNMYNNVPNKRLLVVPRRVNVIGSNPTIAEQSFCIFFVIHFPS